jgi:hypothetical protein
MLQLIQIVCAAVIIINIASCGIQKNIEGFCGWIVALIWFLTATFK